MASPRLVALLALWLLCPMNGSYAQNTPSVLIEALPLVHLREGQIRGCGVRLTGGEPAAPVFSWFDVSFNVFNVVAVPRALC